jgi:hypothetical protein
MSIITALLEIYEIQFSTYDGNHNHCTRDSVEHTGVFFHMVAFLRCGVPSKNVLADNVTINLQGSDS